MTDREQPAPFPVWGDLPGSAGFLMWDAVLFNRNASRIRTQAESEQGLLYQTSANRLINFLTAAGVILAAMQVVLAIEG